jgi:putative ABC transport system permease protein
MNPILLIKAAAKAAARAASKMAATIAAKIAAKIATRVTAKAATLTIMNSAIHPAIHPAAKVVTSRGTQVIPIGNFELLLALLFMLVTVSIVLWLGLGLAKKLTIATLRCYGQLLLLGFVLAFVFTHDSPWLTIGAFLVMIGFGVQNIISLLKNSPYRLFWPVLAAMTVTGIPITFAVTMLVIGVSPWYRAQYVIPLAGMVFGNSMAGIALAAERVFADLEGRRNEVRLLITLGATAWEASLPSVRSAVKAGLVPTINRTATVGVVAIPGMMTGQILAGANPLEAARYQIVVMLMLAAASSLGAISVALWSYKKAFDPSGALR